MKLRNLEYIDLASPLFDEDGHLRDVFREDGLHLNDHGYELWNRALAPYVK